MTIWVWYGRAWYGITHTRYAPCDTLWYMYDTQLLPHSHWSLTNTVWYAPIRWCVFRHTWYGMIRTHRKWCDITWYLHLIPSSIAYDTHMIRIWYSYTRALRNLGARGDAPFLSPLDGKKAGLQGGNRSNSLKIGHFLFFSPKWPGLFLNATLS